MGAPYYMAYERRYQKVYAAGASNWGHTPSDAALNRALNSWVSDNALAGKRVIEFACGEGACGVILSKLGCVYHGADIAPSAVERAAKALSAFGAAKVSRLDMVNQAPEGVYDAALDVMGLHMLVTDTDRAKYLKNAYNALMPGAPALFFRESLREDAFEGIVSTYEDWISISGSDYETPEPRRVTGTDIMVNIPLAPARARTKAGYTREMRAAGFEVENIIEMDINEQCPYSATIYAHKPL